MITNNKKSGFTLIELLVVVAIISLLSSIVMASLTSARDKANKSKLIQEMEQFATTLELEYSNSGSYNNISNFGGWITAATGTTSCDTFYPTNSADSLVVSANAICKEIVKASGLSNQAIFLSAAFLPGDTLVPDPNRYSVDVWFKDGLLYCIGSSGKSLAGSAYTPDVYYNIGCGRNP